MFEQRFPFENMLKVNLYMTLQGVKSGFIFNFQIFFSHDVGMMGVLS